MPKQTMRFLAGVSYLKIGFIMAFNAKRRKRVLIISFGLVLLAIILAFIAPEERTLGSYIRLIYIHAAVTWVGLALFAISGLLALVYFLTFLFPKKTETRKVKDIIVNWSSASQSTAIIFWTVSVSIGSITAYLTWGGNWWIEPRLRIAVFILVAALVVFQLRQIMSGRSTHAGLNLGLPVSALFLLATTGKLVHPNNAFAKSDSIEMKIYAGLITLIFIVVAANFSRVFVSKMEDSKADIEVTS